MWITDSFFTVANVPPAVTAEAFLDGVRIDSCPVRHDSLNAELEQLKPAERSSRLAGLRLDLNAQAVIDAATQVKLPLGRSVGVFVVVGNSHATRATSRFAQYEMLPGLLSYCLGTTGPAILLSSTCDSIGGALAICQAMIRTGDIDGAIVAGANMLLRPEEFGPSPILSPTGSCRPFAVDRDGSWPGRGYGAIAIGTRPVEGSCYKIDNVTTVSAGKARANFTSPSVSAQQDAVSRAWSDGGGLGDATFIEAHGTATRVGDDIEATALSRAVANSGRTQPLVLGACKANVGHLDACSGLASLSNVIECLRAGQYPRYVHSDGFEPDVDSLGPYLVLGDGSRLPRGSSKVGITINGISGSTTHIVIKSHPT